MPNKPFDKKLYDIYDKKAFQWIKKIIPEGYKVEKNTHKTAVDVLCYKDGDLFCYIELEVKRKWNGNAFEYHTLHLPARKKKYCGLDYPTLFVIFNNRGSKYFCVWSKDVLEAPLLEVSNCYMRKGEMFFDVDMKKVFNSIDKALGKINAQGSK